MDDNAVGDIQSQVCIKNMLHTYMAVSRETFYSLTASGQALGCSDARDQLN